MAMGVLDRFLDAMKLNPEDEEYDYYDDYEEEEVSTRASSRRESKSDSIERSKERNNRATTKITPMRSSRKSSNGAMELCVIKPDSFDDVRQIADTLIAGRTVVLNLEGLNLDVAQRIIDFISGATFALDGNLQKITNYIFVVTPSEVDVSGDFTELMGSVDVSAM